MGVAAEEEEEEEEEAEVAEQEAAQAQQPREEETQNFLERNHLPSMEIGKTSTDSFRIFRDTCP